MMHSSISSTGRFLWPKKIAATFLCHPLMGRFIDLAFGGRIPFSGARIEVPYGGDPRVTAALFWGMYESAEIRFVNVYIDGLRDVIELGSSLGGVASHIAHALLPGRKLICVEANPHLIELLRRNLSRNAPHAATEVVHGAIDYSGLGEVELAIGDSNLSSHLGAGAQVIRVPSVTLAGILDASGFDDYCLVCDIEGAEAAMVHIDSEVLERCGLLIIELHDVFYGGVLHSPSTLIELIERRTRLRLVARYGAVCTFVK